MAKDLPSFVQELLQRRVIRVISMYLVAAFVLLQIGDVSFEPLGLPDWSQKFLIVILALGLPLVAVIAWIFDLTSDGVVRTSRQSTEIERLKSGRKLDLVIIIALLAAFGFYLSRDFLVGQSATNPFDQATVTIDRSVAVLPLKSIGLDGLYFADGMTEELVGTLAAIPDLRVIAANSSSQMDTVNLSDSELGRILNVAHLVKGSVRRANDNVRVALQLVRVADDKVLWTQTFESGLDDVFSIQDEISAKVATSLQSTLYRAALQQRAANRTDNMAAYDAYLMALHFRGVDWSATLEHAQNAARLDPDFVSAQTLIAQAYMTRVGGTLPGMQAYPAARTAVGTALALDPNYAPALIVQAHIERQNRDYVAAEALFRRAKALSPNQSSSDLANLLQMLGRLNEALEEYRRSQALDPFSSGFYTDALCADGSFEQAIAMTEATLSLRPDRVQRLSMAQLAVWHTFLGNTEDASSWVDQSLSSQGPNVPLFSGYIAYALARLGRTTEAQEIINKLEARADRQYVSPVALFWAYFGKGDLDRTFTWLDRAVAENVYLITMIMRTSKLLDELRDDPRFDAALDRLNLLVD